MLNKLLTVLPAHCSVYKVGSNYNKSLKEITTSDLDIVIVGISQDELFRLADIHQIPYTYNSYGGIRLASHLPNVSHFDIWCKKSIQDYVAKAIDDGYHGLYTEIKPITQNCALWYIN